MVNGNEFTADGLYLAGPMDDLFRIRYCCSQMAEFMCV